MAEIDREKLSRYVKGEIALADVLNVNAKHMAALLLTGHNMYSQGRLDDARKIFEGLTALDKRNPYIHGILGSIHQQQEKYDDAIRCYSTAIVMFPSDINSLTNRGEIYLKLGKFAEAAQDFKRAIELDPEKKHAAANRSRILVSLTQEALRIAKERGVQAVLEKSRQMEAIFGSGSQQS